MKTSWFRFITATPVLFDNENDLGGGDLDILESLDKEDDPPADKDDEDTDDDKEDDKDDNDEKLTDDEGRTVNEDGHLINDDGELINEDGELVDENDEVIVPDEDEETDEEKEAEARITHASDLKKAYPDIFKKFPDVKAALYRDQEYSDRFASPKDADTIIAKSKILDIIENDLLVEGNPTELLNTVKKNNPESFKKVAFSILPYLAEADKETYLELAAVPIKQLIRSMCAKFGKDTNEHKAALYVHRYFFDNTDVAAKVKAEEKNVTTKSERELEYDKKIQAIDQREHDNFFNATNASYVARLTKEFRAGLESDDRLSDWLKGTLVEKGLADIKTQLNSDPRFKRQMESLWAQAKTSSYSNDLKSRIVTAALARAKSLVPKVRAKLIADALGKKVKDKKDKEQDDKKDKTNVRKFEDKKSNRQVPAPKKQLTDLDILRGNG